MQVLLCYHDCFEGPLPDLVTEIKKLNMYKSISIITELINARQFKLVVNMSGRIAHYPFDLVFKKMLIDIFPTEIKRSFKTLLLSKNKHTISLQMLLVLLKKLVAHGDYSTLDTLDSKIVIEDYAKIVRLQLIATEEFNKYFDANEVDTNHFIYANYHINNDRNVANEFVRSFYMFEKLCKDKNNFDSSVQAEYKNYYQVFTDRYTYTPTQYLSLLFWELSAYYPPINKLTFNLRWRNIDSVYGKTNMAKVGELVVNDLSKTVQFYQKWAISTENEMWDFSLFNEYPFITSNAENYISISEYTLKNTFFEKLFWNIRSCFPQEDSRAMSFYGRLFERYIQDLTKDAIKNSKKFFYIHEFEYGAARKKSSDAYIKSGEFLLVIESKGFSVLQDTITKNITIEKNCHKLFVDPILQADSSFNEIDMLGGMLENIAEVYIISVTMDNVNAVPAYLNSIVNSINEKKQSPKTKYFFNFNIEEFEMLMYLAEQDIDIFKILAGYFAIDRILPFSEYLRSELKLLVKQTNFINFWLTEARDLMLSMYRTSVINR